MTLTQARHGDVQSTARALASSQRILVVGQTPPPVHGQGVMLALLLGAKFSTIRLFHVRMAFSKTLNDVGRFQLGKLLHLPFVIARIYFARLWHGIDVLYYPPSGPNRIPMYRDIILLASTRWLFRKTIFHMHASGVTELYEPMGWLGKWWFRRAYFQPDAVIRLSDFTPNDALVFQAKQEFVIANGTEDSLPRFAPTLELRKSSLGTPLRILYVGTVCRTKGILFLIEACQQLAQRGKAFHLDIVGGYQPSSFEAEVREQLTQRGIASSVTLWGQQTGDKKWERFAAADIFCFPTYYSSESFPCVLVEALSFGLPIVASLWRGIPSIVDQNVDGLLVPPQDPNAIRSALELLLDEPTRRHAMGVAGRAKYLDRFTTQAHLGAMERAFVAVCNDKT